MVIESGRTQAWHKGPFVLESWSRERELQPAATVQMHRDEPSISELKITMQKFTSHNRIINFLISKYHNLVNESIDTFIFKKYRALV